MLIIIVVCVFIVTDTTNNGIRTKCRQCFQVNVVTIRAAISIDIDGSIQCPFIKIDSRMLNAGCWPFTWWCRNQPLADEQRLLANTARRQSGPRPWAESEDEELLVDHQVQILLLGLQKSFQNT